ncbi:MAG: hypothetical protein QHJ81_03025 [Anaerolineae bacterium]|nr:hypothetical protein [Anaerolineae bacterium]
MEETKEENGGEAIAAGKPRADNIQRWSRWATFALERLPLPYALVVALAALMALAEQVLEYSLDDPTFSRLTSAAVARLLVYPLMAIYILLFLRILKVWAVKALAELRPTVLVSDRVYDEHVRRMVGGDWRIELALLIFVTAIVLNMFLVLRSDLLNSQKTLPSSLPVAAFITANYIFLGWLLLTQVYCSIRHAVALRALAQRPLVVNVFDPVNLLPFGRLSLLHSLPNMGVILIPLIIFGPPTEAGYLVIAFSLVGLLALFIPLWGVHKQIGQAKGRVVTSIHEQLTAIQNALLHGTKTGNFSSVAEMADRTDALAALRKMIQESPNWPFKDTAEVARAILAVASPLIYFILNEIIRAYLLPILGNPG